MTFHHDAPNSHVPDINFLEFLAHALSITNHHSFDSESQKDACKSYTVSVANSFYLQGRRNGFQSGGAKEH